MTDDKLSTEVRGALNRLYVRLDWNKDIILLSDELRRLTAENAELCMQAISNLGQAQVALERVEKLEEENKKLKEELDDANGLVQELQERW